MDSFGIEHLITLTLKLTPEKAKTLYNFFEKCFAETQVYGVLEEGEEPRKGLEMDADEFILINKIQQMITTSGILNT